MEYTQWEKNVLHQSLMQGLNPCCNGIYSMRISIAELGGIISES